MTCQMNSLHKQTLVLQHNLYGYEWDSEASLPSISFLVILRQGVVPVSLPNKGYDPLLVSKIEVVDIGGRAIC